VNSYLAALEVFTSEEMQTVTTAIVSSLRVSSSARLVEASVDHSPGLDVEVEHLVGADRFALESQARRPKSDGKRPRICQRR
jgi:hypothetical protein